MNSNIKIIGLGGMGANVLISMKKCQCRLKISKIYRFKISAFWKKNLLLEANCPDLHAVLHSVGVRR